MRAEFAGLASRGSFAVADEFLFAVSHLILNVALARWLSADDYGAFTVAYTAFLLAGTVHTALLTEPFMVFGASKYNRAFDHYLRLLLKGHLVLTMPLGAAVAAVSLLFEPSGPLATALLYLGFAGPLILLPWLLRRTCYVMQRPHVAVLGGAMYCAVVLGGLWTLAHTGLVSVAAALLLMSGASIVASLLMLYGLGSGHQSAASMNAREAVADHWDYGRWALGSAFLTWLPTSLYYLLLPRVGGLESAGALKAVMNLVLPILHGYTALSLVLLPAVAGAATLETLRYRLKLALPLYLIPAGVYGTVVTFHHGQVFEWLYGGQYADSSWLLALSTPMTAAAGVAAVCVTGLRALRRPDRVFLSYACASGAAVSAGVILTIRYQLLGAVLGITLSYVVVAVAAGVTLLSALSLRNVPRQPGP